MGGASGVGLGAGDLRLGWLQSEQGLEGSAREIKRYL